MAETTIPAIFGALMRLMSDRRPLANKCMGTVGPVCKHGHVSFISMEAVMHLPVVAEPQTHHLLQIPSSSELPPSNAREL